MMTRYKRKQHECNNIDDKLEIKKKKLKTNDPLDCKNEFIINTNHNIIKNDKKKRKICDEQISRPDDSNGYIQDQIKKLKSKTINHDNDNNILNINQANDANSIFDRVISNDIYIYLLSHYLTDQDHISLCCTNQYSYTYWSVKINLKQTYNEQVLINTIYRSSIFRSQVRYIQSSDAFNSILTADMFLNTFITHLIFGWEYNQLTNHLPSSITHLTFGHYYNQPLKQSDFLRLPSLTYLKFGVDFNQRLDFVIVGDCLVKCNLYLHELYKARTPNLYYPIETSSFQSVSFFYKIE
jgi:hypothetical protein